MSILHASRSLIYRNPFGAVPTDSEVELFFDCYSDAKEVTLCYAYGLYKMTYHEEPMKVSPADVDSQTTRYTAHLEIPHERGLLFYWFSFVLDEESKKLHPEIDSLHFGKYYYVAFPDDSLCEGYVYYEPPRVGADENKYPYAWQITVYDKDFVTPDSMKGAVIYQIFPDRFCRGTSYDYEKISSDSSKPERIFHKNWYEDVDIEGKPSTGYIACDFFGGSLQGILEKLDYLESLNVNIIYLNPIFEARSSHRYDTSDYLNVDPILGGNDVFIKLLDEAKKRNISIIIDGVFSHTGADSRYFDKYGRYDGVGAFESFVENVESPYRSWYSFKKDEDGRILYDSWWGFPELPNVNENDLSYRRFIFGKNGVVETWINNGVGGIRLDVSDELPDGFIRQMRDTLKRKSNNEAMLVGEVWEDASNKCSYGSYRDFLLGKTHDSVMGYTFRTVVIDFLLRSIDAEVLDARLEGFRERYPMQAYYCIMNLISSHDVPRAMTVLSGQEDDRDRAMQQLMKVSKLKYARTTKLMRIALAFQIGYIGATSLYYGDEVLMEGYKDPFNRRTYPWGQLSQKQNEELYFSRQLLKLRQDNPVLRTGYYRTLVAEGDFLVFERYCDELGKDYFGNTIDKGARKILLLINRCENSSMHVMFSDDKAIVQEVAFSSDQEESYIRRVDSLDARNSSIDVVPCSFSFIMIFGG
ncbi:MAG TPA: glycoside hydrolase family 13 protein [Saccharofermentans sp.]|nr:glycoside hydrolase family 13 protein [Saccharofermentans sp.]HUM24246.1 glycoside hydrolase family 13 protein [Saccharofermentans sp.]